jgi:hypothetical protein
MADTAGFPYETRLNILHGPLEVIDINVPDAKNYKWFNQTLCKVNDSVVRVGIIEGEYHWHKHDNEDEFFLTVEGQLARVASFGDGVEHSAVDPAEYCAVGTDGECQHQYGGEGEPRALAKLPQGKAKILEQSGHGRLLRDCSWGMKSICKY